MTYARITDGAIDTLGNLPAGARRLDTGAWVTPPKDGWTPALLAACGWFEVTETPRPDDTTEGTHTSDVVVVDGLPVRVWTYRAWTVEELAAQAHSVDTFAAIEAIVTSKLLPPPVEGEEPTFAELAGSQAGAIFTGQRFVWTDGNVWEANTGPLNSNATPATWPQGYSQITGLPPDVAPFVAGEAVKIGDLREYEGIVYRCIQAHTTQAGWAPPLAPALWTPQG